MVCILDLEYQRNEDREMTEKEKMIKGLVYYPVSPQLVLDRDRASKILTKYNYKTFHEVNMRNRLMKKLINTSGNF